MPPKIEPLTDRELQLLKLICTEDGCYRERASGYICCIQCMHGESGRAEQEAVDAKKKHERNERIRRKYYAS